MRGTKYLKNMDVTVVTNRDSGDDGMTQACYGKLLEFNRYGLFLQDTDGVKWINLNIVDYIFQGNQLDVVHVEVPK